MRYFDHDTTASSDSLIINLRLTHGGAAVDAYYTVLEEIYANERPVAIGEDNAETRALSHRLAVAYHVLAEYVETMVHSGLLYVHKMDDDGTAHVMSERAEANIQAYREKCEKARQAGKKGGLKSKRKQTAKRTLSERQANVELRKEKKGDKTYSVLSPTSGGADADKTAPPSVDYADWKAQAIPCPDELNPFKAVG